MVTVLNIGLNRLSLEHFSRPRARAYVTSKQCPVPCATTWWRHACCHDGAMQQNPFSFFLVVLGKKAQLFAPDAFTTRNPNDGGFWTHRQGEKLLSVPGFKFPHPVCWQLFWVLSTPVHEHFYTPALTFSPCHVHSRDINCLPQNITTEDNAEDHLFWGRIKNQ